MSVARPMSASRARTTSVAAFLAAAAVGLLWAAAPVETFVSGILFPRGAEPSAVALRAAGPKPYDTLRKPLPAGLKMGYLRRMPNTNYDNEEIMKRIVTILLKNMGETFRLAPLRTKDIMKEIGLHGHQIKTKKFITPALQMLQSQKVIFKCKQNPARWEIHEEYRKYGVPPISKDKRDPWGLSHLLKFKRTKVPRFGPAHGMYRPQDRDFLKEKDLPLASIWDPILRPDPYMISGANLALRNDPPADDEVYEKPDHRNKQLPDIPRDEDGNLLQFDWEKEQKM